MPRPRKSQVSLSDTPYYHCVSRCVRRTFLCGEDRLTGKSYEHRRQWVEDRLHFLAQVFSIDICAYAVMHNHTHVVLEVAKDEAEAWSTLEVLNRWHQLHKGTLLTQAYMDEDTRMQMSDGERLAAEETAEVYRQRLYDLSWFMRHLNEYIAREANKEDGCTGRFWEGRFKSQALLDEAALMACMAYVDLNPIRANMAKTPETSKHTSIQYRINAARVNKQAKRLQPFVGNPRAAMPKGLPFHLRDYLELVDVTGRCIVKGKSGYIDDNQPPILQRLNIPTENWLQLTTNFERLFTQAVGAEHCMQQFKCHQGLQRIKGMGSAKQLLSTG